MCRKKSTCRSSVSVGGSIRICEVVGWLTLTEDMYRMRDAVKTTSTLQVHKLREIFIYLFIYCLLTARLLVSLEGLGLMKLDVIIRVKEPIMKYFF
jgi:hypothetical protein